MNSAADTPANRPSGTRPKIAVFIPSLRGGGVERNMLNLTAGLADAGCGVDLVLAQAEGPFLDKVDPRVRVVDLRARRVLTALPGLVRYLKEARPTALLSGMGHANIVAVVAKALARVGTRLTISEHTLPSVITGVAANTRSRTVPWLSRLFYPRADAVVAVSRAVLQDLVTGSGLDPESITVIPNPVVTPKMKSSPAGLPDHPYFRPGNPPVLLGVGRLSREKGFDVLLRALPLVLQERDCRLLILGEGEERPRLEALVRDLDLGDKADLPGFVDEVPPYLAAAAVMVMPSRVEGFGNALVEAMAQGTPVVAADCPGGPVDILAEGRFGPLVAVEDPAALAAGIVEVLDAPTDPEVLRRRASDFSVAVVTGRYLDVLLDRQNGR